MYKKRPLLELALVAVVVAALAPVSAAAAHGDPEPGVPALDRAAATAIDVAIIAEHEGWTPAATRQHMTDQDRFGALQVTIETRFPTTFAGAEFAEAPGGKSWLRFKGAVPAAAQSLVAESGLDVGLTGGRSFSATESANRAVAVVKHLVGAGHRPVSAEVLPDGQIEVSASGAATPGSALPPALRDGVRVTFADHQVAGNLHGYGGARVNDRSGGDRCTTGFSVEHQITGETGVTTAAHCDGMDEYEQPWSTDSYDFPFQDQHIGTSGEVEWHTTTGHIDVAEYYADGNPADLREVNSVETGVATNNIYCLYSHVGQDRTCDGVRSTYVAVFTTGLASNLVGMDDFNAEPGDSGGPWSYSTEAAGSVVGWYWSWFANRDAWSRGWSYDNALDVEILTQ
jgi:streptogrisin C